MTTEWGMIRIVDAYWAMGTHRQAAWRLRGASRVLTAVFAAARVALSMAREAVPTRQSVTASIAGSTHERNTGFMTSERLERVEISLSAQVVDTPLSGPMPVSYTHLTLPTKA